MKDDHLSYKGNGRIAVSVESIVNSPKVQRQVQAVKEIERMTDPTKLVETPLLEALAAVEKSFQEQDDWIARAKSMLLQAAERIRQDGIALTAAQTELAKAKERCAELEKIGKFLLGEDAFMGFWFGERPASEPQFWWRKHLRAALNDAAASGPKEK